MGKYKVYISSTYRDLKNHRQQVIEFFRKKTIGEIFDLISMEGYVADNTEPAIECLQDVAQCDIYILIIGNRYGYIPPNTSVNPAQLSITELEYRTAVSDPQKNILAFFGDETDTQFEPDNDADAAVLADKKSKLAAFKKHIRETRLTHPEPFISSYHLALQIAEALMRRSLIAYKLEESRKYCCDRIQQFTRYLQVRNKGRFKTIVIYGDRSELGLNLVNRFSIFTLGLSDTDTVPPLTFEEFLTGDRYEQCRTDLLVYIYFRLFNNWNMEDTSVPAFFASIQPLNKPLVVVINCEADMFGKNQLDFLHTFLEEMYAESIRQHSADMYLFLNFEDNKKNGDIDGKIRELQAAAPHQSKYLYVLPRLQPLSEAFIRNWLLTYVSPDQGKVEELMELSFSNLPAPVSMRVAEKSIHLFIQQVNNKNEKVLQIIN